ncbi:MAG: efflux RND transporter permease subunit [bacterium]
MITLLVKQYRAINICFVLVFILGSLSLSKLGREELPEFGEPGLNIQAILPGASPEEMDLKVARLLNKAVVSLPGVDEVHSVSGEGYVSLSVSVKDDEYDLDGVRREIAQITSQVPDLPAELEGPFISRQFNRLFPPITLLFKGGSEVERHNAWLLVEQKLLNLPEVDLSEVLGDRERRIEVRADPLVMEQAGMRLDTLAKYVGQSITDASSGKLYAQLATKRIRTYQQPTSAVDLGAIMLPSTIGILPISYFANVIETLAPRSILVTHENEQAWYINLYRREGSNVSELSRKTLRIVDEFNEQYETRGQPFRITVLHDRSRIVTESLSELTSSILLGMGIVFLMLWIFLGGRNAFYAAIGIPFSFFAAFIAMDLLGLTINTLTLFGLVLVCGMIVDDAIVVLENIDRKKEQGLEPLEAITQGLKEVAPAVLAATGTTVAVFMPLMLMSGGMGEYISLIPKVAILALVASLVECFIVLPIHMYQIKVSVALPKRSWRLWLRTTMDRLADFFGHCSVVLLRRPFWSLFGFLCLFFVTSGVAYLKMDFKLFEATETRAIMFHIEFDRVIDLESNYQLLKFTLSQLGEIEKEFTNVVLINGFKNHNYQRTERENVASVELLLTESAIGQGTAVEIADKVEAKLIQLPGVLRVQRSLETNSPPTGTPVEVYLYSEDAVALRETGRRVREALYSIDSIRHVSDPMEDGVRERVFKLDSRRTSFYGLNSDLIASLIRTSVTGIEVGKIDRGDEIVDVYVTSDLTHEPLNSVAQADGTVIPTRELGKFYDQTSADVVRRFQGFRYISIAAEVDEKVMSVFKTHREIESLIDQSILLPGVTFDQRGEYSETQKSLASMIQAGLIGLGLSYFILTLLFRSFLQPIVVLLAIPLAYMGVVWGMTLTGQTLDLMGFVGVVGLMGIVINDSLVWVNFYNRAREEGIDAINAAVGAVRQRFRPIWLTTITTVGGLIPVSLSESAGIANAMANTMVYGLTAASLLLLLFLPVCVVAMDQLVIRVNQMAQSFRLPALKISPKRELAKR